MLTGNQQCMTYELYIKVLLKCNQPTSNGSVLHFMVVQLFKLSTKHIPTLYLN